MTIQFGGLGIRIRVNVISVGLGILLTVRVRDIVGPLGLVLRLGLR